MSCERIAREKLAWFDANKPAAVAQSLTPPWATFLFRSVEGGLKTMVRLGREIDQIDRKGHLLVNVSPQGQDADVDNDPTAEEARG